MFMARKETVGLSPAAFDEFSALLSPMRKVADGFALDGVAIARRTSARGLPSILASEQTRIIGDAPSPKDIPQHAGARMPVPAPCIGESMNHRAACAALQRVAARMVAYELADPDDYAMAMLDEFSAAMREAGWDVSAREIAPDPGAPVATAEA